jgi:hypothetical protein
MLRLKNMVSELEYTKQVALEIKGNTDTDGFQLQTLIETPRP